MDDDPLGGGCADSVNGATSRSRRSPKFADYDNYRTAFSPVPKDVACTEIYGGPQEALVRGTLEGRRVWARFSRRDGCQIDRWNRHRFLFGGVATGPT